MRLLWLKLFSLIWFSLTLSIICDYTKLHFCYFQDILNNNSRLNKARMWRRKPKFSNLIRCFWILKVQKFSFRPKFKYPFYHIRWLKHLRKVTIKYECRLTLMHIVKNYSTLFSCLIYWFMNFRELSLFQSWKFCKITIREK